MSNQPTSGGLHPSKDAGYSTLQFASDKARAADQARRDELNAYRDRLGVTLRELAELLSRLHGDRVSYWTVRAWTSGQDSRRARLTPRWPIKLLDERFSSPSKRNRQEHCGNYGA